MPDALTWSAWQPFPDPRKGGFIFAPFGEGVYGGRNAKTGEPILFGRGRNCACRMASLLPAPLGCGTRNNRLKREYVLANIKDLEYRCAATPSKTRSEAIEAELKASAAYRFPT